MKKNRSEAAKGYRSAAEQGYDEAQFATGACYQHGYGVELDLAQAELWYRKAADQGHKRAKNALKKLFLPEDAKSDKFVGGNDEAEAILKANAKPDGGSQLEDEEEDTRKLLGHSALLCR